MYSIVYFSPTGNVKHLAYKIAYQLEVNEEAVFPLEFTKPESLVQKEHLVLLYPVHGFNASRTVKRFVNNLPAGIFQSVSLIGVGCTTIWLNAAVSNDLRKVLQAKKHPIIVDEILGMPLTFIMSFPDKVSYELIEESELKIKEIGQAIIYKKESQHIVPFKARVVNLMGKIESPAARLFGLELYANKKCDSCSICWNNCPEQNIKQHTNGKPKFGFNCIMCMRCIYNCPQKAISPRFSKFIPISKGYSLKKLLETR